MNIQEKIIMFIKGETLLNEEGLKFWRMILFVIVLLLLMIRSGHITDAKVLKIARLKKLENELRAEYIALRSKTMTLKMETTIIEKVKNQGIKPADRPAQVIKEIDTK